MNHLLEQDKAHVWHPFTPLAGAPDPLLITSAQGVYLHTHDGRKIIDAVSSWWVNLHGHANPVIADAVAEQARTLEHVIFAGFTHEPAIRLTENLLRILPTGMERIFFSDNGSTAVEVGIKMALQYWHNQGVTKQKVIALRGAYHGDTFGAMAVGDRGIFTAPFHDHLFDVVFIDFPTPGANEEGTLQQLATALQYNDVAALIYEPLVQAAGGMRIYDASALERMMQLARKHEALCIADEVFSGFGRTGKLFASDYVREKPDIIAVSKGITGGTLPLGVTACTATVTKAFASTDLLKTFFHGHSYTANPLACAAANASFGLLTSASCQDSIARIVQRHQDFASHIKGHTRVKHVRTLGTILALEIVTAEGTAYENTLRTRIYPYFLERNILLRPLGNVIYVLPPYVISDDELQIVYNAIEDFLNLLKADS